MIMQKRVINFTSKASSTIIYQSRKLSWYVWLLIITKFLRCSGLYLAFDIVKRTHAINFVWILSLICSVLFGVVQRPFSAEKEIKLSTWLKILQYSLLQNGLLILLFYGLSQVGPFRTSLLIEHSDVVLLAVGAAVLKGVGGPSKLRGSVCFILAVLSLLLLDNDSAISEHPEGHSHNGVKHIVFYLISWMGLSDHEGGLLILLVTTVLMLLLNYRSQSLSVEVGGSKRFNSLAWIASFGLLCPCVLLLSLFDMSSIVDELSSIHLIFIVSLLYFVFHYYVISTCSQKLTSPKTAQIGTIAFLVFSLLLSYIWPEREQASHEVSGGAVFSLVLFSLAVVQVTSTNEYFGLDKEDLLPFHHISIDAMNRSHSLLTFFYSTLQTILLDRNSRTIFYFLCVNLGFTFVELIYGMWTNSLGLISDGFHMLFDCSALVMGLTASVMAQWKPSKKFPYGYGRIEILSGFVNGLFLSVIGLMVFIEAIERMFEPPPIRTEKLLTVAVCGLIVNICGILAFSSNNHGHSHGGSHSFGQQGQHGHTHTHKGDHSHVHSHNINMEGVFLHILADTLGSVAVIVSSFLIDWYGWLIADPICSLILSILILSSVFSLLKNSASVLLLEVPVQVQLGAREVIDKILNIESVVSCENPHFWEHCDDITVATVNVFISGDIPEQKIMHKVISVLQEFGYSHVTVQIEVALNPSTVLPKLPSTYELGSILKVSPKKPKEVLFSISDI